MKDRNKKENQNSLSNSEYFPSIEIVNIAWNDADGGRVREKGLDCECCVCWMVDLTAIKEGKKVLIFERK